MSAAILRACSGSTRVSESPVTNITAGYFDARLDVLVGRVGAQPVELRGILGRAVLGHPEARDQEAVVAQHVEQRHLAEHRAEQVGALRHRRAHQQAAVAAADDGEALGACSSRCAISHCAAAMKSSNTCCLFAEHAAAVPGLAELAAAAQVRAARTRRRAPATRRRTAENAGVSLTLKPP